MSELFRWDWRIMVADQAYTGHDVRFEIEKTIKREPNTCQVAIFNLSEAQRNSIQALSLPKKKSGTNTGKIPVEVEAGYVGARALWFRGDLRTAQSVRDGADWITTVEGEDGGRSILTSRINESFPEGTPVATVVRACVRAMGLGLGNVQELSSAAATRAGTTFANGTVLSGKADQELTHVLASCGLTWSVQNGNVQLLKAGQALSTSVLRLAAGTGLLGAPIVNPDGTIEATVQMVAGLFPGGRAQIDSSTVRGVYTVQKIRTTGDSAGTEWGHVLTMKV